MHDFKNRPRDLHLHKVGVILMRTETEDEMVGGVKVTDVSSVKTCAQWSLSDIWFKLHRLERDPKR